MRLTMKNPGGRNYRLPCARESEDLRVDMGREYPTLFGNKIDIIGKLERKKGGEEPWVSLGYAIQRWRRRK